MTQKSKAVAAVIVESSGKAVELKEQAGIFTCLLEHEVKATKATFNWTGPKMTQEAWDQMLSYFKWTYDIEKSEAQVRLFVHPTLGWKIWAFPQKGGTGMATKEVDAPEAATQRAEIGDGYVQWGTVHHHCSSSAFQSSTDTSDEKAVEGLHITVGWIDKAVHDLHCRIYIKGHKFEPNMAEFWDIGDEAREKIEWVSNLKFKTESMSDAVARNQMAVQCPPNTVFPEMWKTNYILPERRNFQPTGATFPGESLFPKHSYSGPTGKSLIKPLPGKHWCHHCNSNDADHKSRECPKKKIGAGGFVAPDWFDRKTVEEMWDEALKQGVSDEAMSDAIMLVKSDHGKALEVLFEIAGDNFTTPAMLATLAIAVGAEADSETAPKQKKDTSQEEDDREKALQEYFAAQEMMGM